MDEKGVTLITVFEVAPDRVDAFVEQWRERAELMRAAPGFRDARLHRARTAEARFQLINVANWDSAEAMEAARADPAFQESVRLALEDAVPHPVLYDVVVEYP
jgi:quinol monooxygenase YgiN